MAKVIKMINMLYRKIKDLSCINNISDAKDLLSISSMKTVRPKEARRLRQNTLILDRQNSFFDNLFHLLVISYACTTSLPSSPKEEQVDRVRMDVPG